MAPWNLSSNFVNATIGKCSLELYGLGDPSGRGEAFSFVKVPTMARPISSQDSAGGSAARPGCVDRGAVRPLCDPPHAHHRGTDGTGAARCAGLVRSPLGADGQFH